MSERLCNIYEYIFHHYSDKLPTFYDILELNYGSMPNDPAQLDAMVLEKYAALTISAEEYQGRQHEGVKGKEPIRLRGIKKRRNNEGLTARELEDERQAILEASASVMMNKALREEYDSSWMRVHFREGSINTRGAVVDACGWKT